jgi:hypothetical protein
MPENNTLTSSCSTREAPINRVLGRLTGLRAVGQQRWMALCPAHPDKRPSLSIREGDDARVLIYCFAGCGAVEILDAIGLDSMELFPRDREPLPGLRPTRARPIPAEDALEILDHEALTLEIIAHGLMRGEPLERYGHDLKVAAGRVAAIRQAWLGRPR